MDANSKNAMHSIRLIKRYQKLALRARDAGEFLGKRAEITWEHGEGHLSEWREHTGDVLYQLADYYEKRILNLKGLLKELIENSEQPLTLPINWEDVVNIPPPFHKIL